MLDTSALVQLCIPLPEECLTEAGRALGRPVRLIDAIPWLARHGYEVIVPEMVGVECDGVLRDGQSISQYFDRDPRAEQKSWHIPTAFLSTIPRLRAEGADIRIEPPADDDISFPAQHVRRLWEIHSGSAGRTEKRNQIIHEQRNHRPNPDAGDNAAYNLIAKRKGDVPVFYLTKDAEASDDILSLAPQVPTHCLGAYGFYMALQNAGLLSGFGIRSKALPAIKRHIDAATYFDTPGPNDFADRAPGESIADQNALPFFKSVHGLSAALSHGAGDTSIQLPAAGQKLYRNGPDTGPDL